MRPKTLFALLQIEVMCRDQKRFGFRNKPKYLKEKANSFDFRVGDLNRRESVEIRLRTVREQHVFRFMSII